MVEAIAAVIIISVLGGVFIAWMGIRFEEKKLTLRAKSAAGSGDLARLEQILTTTQTEVTRLRERVQVLEKLVTDDDRRLSGEIDRLRDDARR